MKKLLIAIYRFFVSCPDNLGHSYGGHSDLCHNIGCYEERGSWKPCEGDDYWTDSKRTKA